MPTDPFSPPDTDDHRQKTPDCKHRETEEEREDNRARGVFGAASCTKPHVCNLYVGHAAERHRARKCGHWFGITPDSPKPRMCGKPIGRTVPSWAGEDQIDPCTCVLVVLHDEPCACEHDVATKAQAIADHLTAQRLPTIVAELTEAERNALLKTFPPCDCGSVMVMPDGRLDDLGEHDEECEYHRAAVAAFGPTSFTGSGAPVQAWPQMPSSIHAAPAVAEVTRGTKCPHCDADLTAGARIGDSTRALADEHAKTCPEPGSFRAIERAGVSFDEKPTPCPSWIWIDGGNDQATCDQDKGHGGEKHTRYGVPPWTDADHERAAATSWED